MDRRAWLAIVHRIIESDMTPHTRLDPTQCRLCDSHIEKQTGKDIQILKKEKQIDQIFN